MDINVLTIINPTSGKGKIENQIEEIGQNIEEQGMKNEIILTQKEKNAKQILDENKENKDLILVCGGDGTLNETVTSMVENKLENVTLSFIPLGTTNDLARTLNIPITIHLKLYQIKGSSMVILVLKTYFNQKIKYRVFVI